MSRILNISFRPLFFTVFLLFSISSIAQKTVVYGTVSDAETKETLPFVNITFKNSKIGTTSDINGKYRLETYYPVDSIQASFVGYKRQAFKVKKDKEQVINFTLKQSSVQLTEFVVKYKKTENPAHEIMKGVIRNKKANNREKLDSYNYEAYNKIEFDINNINEKIQKKNPFLKPFKVVWDFVDTSAEKLYLPLFLTETMSDFHFRKVPKGSREIIKASRISGVQNESVSQFLGDMYQNINIYDNFILVSSKSFVSPVTDFWQLSYNYYLVDSAYKDKKWCYKLKFVPKREFELTFEGDMWIHDTTYAVKEVEATISKNANINYINSFWVRQEYDMVEDEVWMLTKDQLFVDFNISKQTMGLYGRKTSTYRDFEINKYDEKAFDGAENIVVLDSAGEKDNAFWVENRHEALTEKEVKIYNMIDTIQNVPAFRTWIDVITMFMTGYKKFGKLEFGPYFSLYSFNQVEGHRMRVGFRTSSDFSRKMEFSGHLAYGTLDQNWKYGLGGKIKVIQKPRLIIGAYYYHDLEQLGQSANAWRQDNIIASIFRRNPFNKLSGYDNAYIYFDKDWFQGFSNKLTLSYRKIWPLGALDFQLTDATTGLSKPVEFITTSEVSLYTRFAYKEKYISSDFSRVSLGTKAPIFQVQLSYGMKGVLNSQYEYTKTRINMTDRIRINPLGYTDYTIEVGKIWGTLPYPLLELHNGNETFFYDVQAYNLMNYFEFASDEYASVSITHHFNGLFLNKIPLMRRLHLREVGTFKAVQGRLNDKHYSVMDFPSTTRALTYPYMEAGIGIENIAKIFRIDMIWRLSYLDNPNIIKWGFRSTFQFDL